jgi:hypothetical protein
MCKKLMFLISFVALLGLVNIVSAVDWTGGGATRDWCDADNWDGSVPAPGENAVLKPGTPWEPLVQGPGCSADFDKLEWDLGSSDAITLDIVDAVFRLMENEESGDGLMTVNVSGTSNVDCWDDRWRWGNHGYGIWNQSGDTIVHINGDFRGGDEDDGLFDLNMSSGVLDVEGEFLIGDDGDGVATITGGDIVFENVNLAARKGGHSAAMVMSNGEMYVDENFRMGKDCKDGGGFASLDLTGGTINADEIRLSVGSCVDVNVTVDGGLLIARQHLRVGEGDGVVNVALTSGEIRIESGSSLQIDNGKNLNITDGVLKIKGNVTGAIGAMVCDGSGRLTGFGGPQGIVIAYDGEYTIVTATTAFDPDQAYCPLPGNGAERVQSDVTEVVLQWTVGDCIGTRGRNLVYFGSDCDAVDNATQSDPEFQGLTGAGVPEFNIGNLPLWSCWCWRIDTFCQAGNTVKGNLWSFCTGCEDIPGDVNRDCLVNFEDYACVAADFGLDDYWPLD